MLKSSLGAFLAALNIALVIVVMVWLHRPPLDYKRPPRDQKAQEHGDGRQNKRKPSLASEANRNSHPSQKDAKDGRDNSGFAWITKKSIDEPLIPLTFFLVVANGLLALVSIQQAKQTRILQRAYLSVKPLGISCRKGDLWFGTVGIHNAGRLPARDVRWIILTQRFSFDDDWKDFPQVNATRKGPVVPPGATIRRASKPFSVEMRVKDERFMYVWGALTYTDGFGVSRYTKFCHRYNSKAIVSTSDGGFCVKPEDGRYHDHGNEAT